jgi:hypothetical protein
MGAWDVEDPTFSKQLAQRRLLGCQLTLPPPFTPRNIFGIPATCSLCDGPHPANYKGCEFYHNLLKPNNTNNRLNIQRNHAVNMPTSSSPVRPELPQPTINNTRRNASYADVTRGVPHTSQPKDDTSTITLNRFLTEFKSMFNQLIQQNTMILNMLWALLPKIHNG